MVKESDFEAFRRAQLKLPYFAHAWPGRDVEAEIAAAWRRDLEVRAAREEARVRLIGERFPARAVAAARAADTSTPAIAAISEWANANEEGIAVLAGVPGCGKTTAATWWALELQHGRPAPMFLRATELASTSRFDADARAHWMRASALVLDDLGTEYADAKGSFRVDLDELVDVFYAGRRTLVITTNGTRDEFHTRYGERIYDRLRECGAWLTVTGGSLRGQTS